MRRREGEGLNDSEPEPESQPPFLPFPPAPPKLDAPKPPRIPRVEAEAAEGEAPEPDLESAHQQPLVQPSATVDAPNPLRLKPSPRAKASPRGDEKKKNALTPRGDRGERVALPLGLHSTPRGDKMLLKSTPRKGKSKQT